MGGLHTCGAFSGSINGVKSTRQNNRGQVSSLWCNAGRSHTHAISSLRSSFRTNDLVTVRTQNISDSA